jgi:hypothetical protein
MMKVVEVASRIIALAALFFAVRPGQALAQPNSQQGDNELRAVDQGVVSGMAVEVAVDNSDDPPPRSE